MTIPETSEAFTAWYVRENAASRLTPEADELAKLNFASKSTEPNKGNQRHD